MRLTEKYLRNIIKNIIKENHGFLHWDVSQYEYKKPGSDLNQSDIQKLKDALPDYFIINSNNKSDVEMYVNQKTLSPSGKEMILPLKKNESFIYFKTVKDDKYGKLAI